MTISEHLVEPVKGVNNQWKCPHCGNTTRFRVEAEMPLDLTLRESGAMLIEVDAADAEWNKDAYCLCLNEDCGEFGTVKDFNPEEPEA